MAIIIGIDALEIEYVKEFQCKNLMLKAFGKTDISEYEEPRTMVLWSSFLAEKNLEKEIVSLGKEKMWYFTLKKEETFLKKFEKTIVKDVPGFDYNPKQHDLERNLLKKFFTEQISVQEFDKPVLEYHRSLKEQFLADLEKEFDLLFYYFNAADVIGHVSFGDKAKMKLIYRDLDELVGKALEKGQPMLVLSDHGMKAVGSFGDHQEKYGFWSNNLGKDLSQPKITDLGKFVEESLS